MPGLNWKFDWTLWISNLTDEKMLWRLLTAATERDPSDTRSLFDVLAPLLITRIG